MGISDEDFREAFKPLQIPAHYADAVTDEEKIIYSLAQLGEGSATEVGLKLEETDPQMNADKYKVIAESILNGFFEKGLLNGAESRGVMTYNLHKITEANDGAVNRDLLAPGLD